MKQFCKYSPERDIAPHRPSLHIDISQVFDTMDLPVGGAFSTDFEDVDDTDSIGPRIENNFDVVEYGISLNENLRAQEYTSGTGNLATPLASSTPDGGAE